MDMALPDGNGKRASQRMRRNRLSGADAEPLVVRGHHLMCAVCARGGCKDLPSGKRAVNKLLKVMWEYPYISLKVMADIDVCRAHFLRVYEKRGTGALPKNFQKRNDDYVWRRRDLEVCRVLGIVPNTEIPAFFAYTILLARQRSPEGICRTDAKKSKAWPECPQARKGYYEKIAGARKYGLAEQTRYGEKMDGKGIWAMIRPRTREDMKDAKKKSAAYIMEKADRLYMRPMHVLCLFCRPERIRRSSRII